MYSEYFVNACELPNQGLCIPSHIPYIHSKMQTALHCTDFNKKNLITLQTYEQNQPGEGAEESSKLKYLKSYQTHRNYISISLIQSCHLIPDSNYQFHDSCPPAHQEIFLFWRKKIVSFSWVDLEKHSPCLCISSLLFLFLFSVKCSFC